MGLQVLEEVVMLLFHRPPYLSGKPMSFLSFPAEGEQIYQRKVCTPHPASFFKENPYK